MTETCTVRVEMNRFLVAIEKIRNSAPVVIITVSSTQDIHGQSADPWSSTLNPEP